MLVPTLTLLIWTQCITPTTPLTLEKVNSLESVEEVTTAKVIKINNGILFENGVLKQFNPIKEEEVEEEEETDPIVFNDEALKVLEMLSNDSVHFNTLHLNLTVDHYHGYDILQVNSLFHKTPMFNRKRKISLFSSLVVGHISHPH